jgi:hypothetical protein
MVVEIPVTSRGPDNFEFFFEGKEGMYWRVRNHPDLPEWFPVEEFRNLERTLGGLFGEKSQIEKVMMR